MSITADNHSTASLLARFQALRRQPLHLRERNRARDYYNPLRGLDMARLVRLLEAGERGEHSDLQWLYRTIEKRDATVRGLKLRRLSALKKLDWDIKLPDELPAGISQEQADAQAASLRAVYEGIENLPNVFEFLALASFRGFAHLEKHWKDDNPQLPLVRLEPVPQWHWVRDPDTWAWRYDANAQNDTSGSAAINAADFVIRELDDPINEIAAIAFLRKNMSQKDWDAFVEDFGIPSIFGILGPNTPAGEVKAWLDQMEKVTGNSRGALPPGSDIKSVAFGSQGETPFKSHKDEQREEVVLAGTGGLLSMLTAPTGLNSDQAQVHEAAFDAIALADAAEISALLQTQIDKPHMRREFPGQPVVAYFQLAAIDSEDRSALGDLLVKLAQAGLESDENEISEKTGLKLVKKPQPPPGGAPGTPAPFANRKADGPLDAPARTGDADDFLAQAAADLAAADRATLAPLIERAAALAAIDDDDAFAKAAAELQADLPELEKQILSKQSNLETAFSNILATAFRNGSEAAASKRRAADPDAAPFANVQRGFHELRDPANGQFAEGGQHLEPKENIKKGDNAIAIAMRRRADVKNAMQRNGIGNIDFEWGTPGDPNNDYKGGHGLSHILAKHPGAEKNITRIIADGKITKHVGRNPQYPDSVEWDINHPLGVVGIAKRTRGRGSVITSFAPSKKKGPAS